MTDKRKSAASDAVTLDVPIAAEPAAQAEPVRLEQPRRGGSYVRRKDGTLVKKED